MSKYIITTESGSDLSKELIERYNIHVIPMYVTMGDQTRPDGSFPVQELFDYYEETGELPKTAGSTPGDNAKVFKEIFEKYPDAHIIHIGYSAVTTVSFNAANIAAQDFENVHLVDSKHVTIGLTAIVKATAEFIENNPDTTPEEIIAFIEDVRERTHMFFLPETLTYLRAGGRVSNLAFYGANLLRIKPSIVLENGYLVSGKRYRETFDRCVGRMIDDFLNTYNLDPKSILVVGSPSVSPHHKEMISKRLNENGILSPTWMKTGAVISSHGGPGAIGIAGIEIK